eukprot:Em0448g4a
MIFYSKLQTEDGHWVWGLWRATVLDGWHTEGKSTVFGTALIYVTMRRWVWPKMSQMWPEPGHCAPSRRILPQWVPVPSNMWWTLQTGVPADGVLLCTEAVGQATMELREGVLNTYEPWHVKKLRSWAVSECLDHIRADDQFTDASALDLLFALPEVSMKISKVIQMLVRWHADGPDSEAFKTHVSRIPDYLWYVILLPYLVILFSSGTCMSVSE